MKDFFAKYKIQVAETIGLVIITILLATQQTAFFLIRVFGWAVYFYLLLGYVSVLLRFRKPDKKIRTCYKVYGFVTLYCVICSLHTVFANEEMLEGGFYAYMEGSYRQYTAGGVVGGFLSCFLAVPLTPVWAPPIYWLGSTAFGFLFFRPFIFSKADGFFVPRRQPIPKQNVTEEKEPLPQSFNVDDPEPQNRSEQSFSYLYADGERNLWEGYQKGYTDFFVQQDSPSVVHQRERVENRVEKPEEKKKPEAEKVPPLRTEPEKPVYPKPERVHAYRYPPTSLLEDHANPNFVNYVENLEEIREVIEVKLKKHNIDAKLIEAIKGPTVTRVTLELSDNCSIKQLRSVQEDLQRFLCSPKPINILQQIGHTSYCGIEIPNAEQDIVGFKEIICSQEYREKKGEIILALAKSTIGEIVIDDLAKMPHALVAGSTGSGKSVCLNVILASILCRYRPDEVKLILIDMKEVELGVYSGLPHMLFKEPLSDLKQIVNALLWIRQETKDRFLLFKEKKVRNLDEYNALPDVRKMERIVIVIDEASELMSNASVGKTLEATLSSLARVSRAAGVHLIFATQNPVKEVITNEIQNNLNTKIAFAVGDFNHSMVIFKAKGAENLIGNGDMYIKRGTAMSRAQCAFISTSETQSIVDYIIENNECTFDEEMIEKILSGNFNQPSPEKKVSETKEETNEPVRPNFTGGPAPKIDMSDTEYLAWQALKISYKQNYISCSFLQRRLNRGYNTIADVLDFCEEEGYVTRITERKRQLSLPKEEFRVLYAEKFGVDPFEGEEEPAEPKGEEE